MLPGPSSSLSSSPPLLCVGSVDTQAVRTSPCATADPSPLYRVNPPSHGGRLLPSSPSKTLAASHWLRLGHFPIPEPITVARRIQCSDWPDLSHTLPREPVGGAKPPEFYQGAVLAGGKMDHVGARRPDGRCDPAGYTLCSSHPAAVVLTFSSGAPLFHVNVCPDFTFSIG